jgi:hypothetical protein
MCKLFCLCSVTGNREADSPSVPGILLEMGKNIQILNCELWQHLTQNDDDDKNNKCSEAVESCDMGWEVKETKTVTNLYI